MPAVLAEHQLELLDVNDESRSLVFGTEDTGYLTLAPPQWASGDVRAGDIDRAQEDGIYFGRDLRGGAIVSLEIGVLTDHLATPGSDAYRTNVDYTNALSDLWQDEELRNRPWKLAMLRTCVAGRTWRAYGRPRRFEATVGRLQQRGYAPVICDFAVIDNAVYADVAEQLSIPLVVPPEGGLVAPLVAPLTTTLETTNEDVLTIGGTRPTWLWTTFHGPVLNPQVTIGPLTIGLTGSIPDGLAVTVDPRPWSRQVTREDGANYAGMVNAATPVLRELRIPPGTYNVAYRGTDATGTTQCVINWRNARSRP